MLRNEKDKLLYSEKINHCRPMYSSETKHWQAGHSGRENVMDHILVNDSTCITCNGQMTLTIRLFFGCPLKKTTSTLSP